MEYARAIMNGLYKPSGGQELVPKQPETAKSENDSGGSEDAPHGEVGPDARAPAEGAGTQSAARKQ